MPYTLPTLTQALDKFVDEKLDICKAMRDVEMDQMTLNKVRRQFVQVTCVHKYTHRVCADCSLLGS